MRASRALHRRSCARASNASASASALRVTCCHALVGAPCASLRALPATRLLCAGALRCAKLVARAACCKPHLRPERSVLLVVEADLRRANAQHAGRDAVHLRASGSGSAGEGGL
eukprot:5003739-Pleurochrysis_carterae.AAC.2